mmetsp:Transcript_10843/g.24572  ORF Transcript_10843/g.24572 Transcript_10843/m.24572 type:complete len:1132 (+) Transcript_10843:117-3512(+)
MEVTIIDTGDLPADTVISFRTGSIRRHAQVEKDKAINLSYATSSEPIRVDLMSQVGTQTFDMVPGQENYDVNISPVESSGGSEEVKLRLQIRDADAAAEVRNGKSAVGIGGAKNGRVEAGEGHSSVSPSRKLQTALMMRSYLDNHDVLRQMQELLQDMVTSRPEDPIEYMINRLEQVCQDSHPVEVENKEEEEENDDDVGEIDPTAIKKRGRQCSVSAEAYGAFNERKAYQPKVIEKDESQRKRLLKVLRESWMFQSMGEDTLKIIVGAMREKIAPPDMCLIQEGADGDVMWVIEQGMLECSKMIDGNKKVVKECRRGDVFGELALLYNCPRAASVVARDRCILWELDRETFQAVCFEVARGAQVSYEGFTAPTEKAASELGDDIDDEDDQDDQEDAPPTPIKAVGRRTGVSAEASKGGDDGWVPPVHPKTDEEKAQLLDVISHSKDSKLHMLFGRVQKATFAKIVDAVFTKQVPKGESVIEQGSVGDYFYIVRSGDFDIFVQKGSEPAKKVFEATAGFAFGELALLYNAPRTATITASVDSEVWCLDRATFRNLVVRSSEAQFNRNVDFLGGVDIFQGLEPSERAAVAEVLEDEEFDNDEAIVEQGESDDKMFILQSGQAVACIRGDEGEVEVMQYSAGNYFGEIALLLGEPRKASVYAVGHCCCLFIRRDTFIRILGPLTDILSRNIDHYQKYSAAIVQAETETDLQRLSSKESVDESQKTEKKQTFRKREQKVEDLHNIENHQVDKEVDKEEEPTTLAEKVAQDFKNPKLVDPEGAFKVKEAQFSAFGGLAPGQKFTENKVLHYSSEKAVKKTDEATLQDDFCWTIPTKLKCGTEIAVACQKGQKSEFDPTPNQDNYFVHTIGGVSIYGVCDGHGPFGHLVSFRLVQSLPHLIVTSPHFGKDWEATLKGAFVAAQADLVSFCAEQNVNIEASGSAGSVLLMEEQTLHIAFIGDARIMVGSWNQRDSRLIFSTKDHKPELPGEKERLEAAGNDVREVAPEHFRVFLKGRDFPGLTMSRTFGDTICKGVLQEPEYHKLLMQPTDEWYAFVASDGIWEFIEAEEACSLTAKKLRLKGPVVTLDWLVNASRRRWSHVCGAYCDDVTAICVQWNCHNKKESNNNCSLTVKRPS